MMPIGPTEVMSFVIIICKVWIVLARDIILFAIAATTATTLTPAGTTQTVDWDDSNAQVIDLASATGDVTLTLSNPLTGASYIVKVIQDAAAPIDLVCPAAVLWPGGVTPVISVGASAVDTVSLLWDGTNYFATIGQNYS